MVCGTNTFFSIAGLRKQVSTVILLAVILGAGCRADRQGFFRPGSIFRSPGKNKLAKEKLTEGNSVAAQYADQPTEKSTQEKSTERNELAEIERLFTEPVDVKASRSATTVPRQINPDWYLRYDSAAEPNIKSYRWQHSGLERWYSLPSNYRPALRSGLSSHKSKVRTIATIALARKEGKQHIEALSKVISDPTQPLGARRAAVESLARIDDRSTPQRLRTLIKLGLQNSKETLVPANPGLHAELLRGLARYVHPLDDPLYRSALVSGSREVQMEVLNLLAASGRGPLPAEIEDVLSSQDGRLRIAALRTIGMCRDVSSVPLVRKTVRDVDLGIRLAAVETLGRLPSRESKEILTEVYRRGGEKVRQAAVAALASMGDVESLLVAAGDESWRVRLATAEALANWKDHQQASTIAQRLLRDSSLPVQQQTVKSIVTWPISASGALLFEAARSSNQSIRSIALGVLTSHWPEAGAGLSGNQKQRQEALLARLEERWREEYAPASSKPAAAALPASKHPHIVELNHDQIERQMQLFRDARSKAEKRQATEALLNWGPKLTSYFEKHWFAAGRSIPEGIFEEVLSRNTPAFALVEKLRQQQVAARRIAAEDLAVQSKAGGLSPLVLHRIAEVTAAERDVVVWTHLLECIADSSSEPAQRMAYAALWHPSPEIRRRACPYFESHASSQHLDALLPLLRDDTKDVAIAALRAISVCGPVENPAPLIELLSAGNKSLRVEAAAALVSLGYSAGSASIERLSYDFDPLVRQQTAQVIGRLSDPLFLSILIRLLDDRDPVRSAALDALPRVAAEDILSEKNPLPDLQQQAELWKAWYLRGGS